MAIAVAMVIALIACPVMLDGALDRGVSAVIAFVGFGTIGYLWKREQLAAAPGRRSE